MCILSVVIELLYGVLFCSDVSLCMLPVKFTEHNFLTLLLREDRSEAAQTDTYFQMFFVEKTTAEAYLILKNEEV